MHVWVVEIQDDYGRWKPAGEDADDGQQILAWRSRTAGRSDALDLCDFCDGAFSVRVRKYEREEEG